MAKKDTKIPKNRYMAFLGLTLIFSTVCVLSSERTAHSEQGASYHETLLIENGMVSADLEGVLLEKVLVQIQEQTDVWYESDESLLRERISIQFKDLPLKKGMRRILASFDHAIEYNARGELVGLTLFGKSGSKRTRNATRDGSITRVLPPITSGVKSGTTTRVVDLPRPLPVKVIHRKGRAETSLAKQRKSSQIAYAAAESEVNVRVISSNDISSNSKQVAPTADVNSDISEASHAN